MRIRAIKLRVATSDGDYGFQFSFGEGLTIIRGKNSSGKSTLLVCLLYGLGMEELVGGKGEKVLPYAVKDHFFIDEQRVEVAASEVLLEIEGAEAKVVTLRRAIRDTIRDPKLVEVFEGAHLTEGTPLVSPRPTYLFDAGAAQKLEGFHYFLESFIGLKLPKVANTAGSMSKLYLQAVFAAFVVEQKRGWTDYIANIPFFGIRDARTRVTEFLLGLSVFERQATRARLDAESVAIDSDWRGLYEVVRQAATLNGMLVEGLESAPTALFQPQNVQLVKPNGQAKVDFVAYVTQLRAAHAELGSRAQNFGTVLGEQALRELEEASAELQRLSVLHERASSNLLLQRGSMDELRTLAKETGEDLERNKTAAKLRTLGAELEVEVASGHCPTCHQHVDDTLLFGMVTSPQMDLQTNIDYLESQQRMLQRQITGTHEEVRQSEITLKDISGRLAAKRDFRNSLRGDVNTGAVESRALVRQQLQIELELSNLRTLEATLSAKLGEFAKVSSRVAANQAERKLLPKEAYSPRDLQRIGVFEKNFRANAGSFGYTSAQVSDITINKDSLTPTLAEIELRQIISKPVASLQADSSASDFVRLIWSYLLALYQTSSTPTLEGNHAGLLVLDEPGQHSMRSVSQHALLQLVSGSKGLQSIVAASFDEDDSVFNVATAGLKFKFIEWEGKVIGRLPS
jgi:hypothetical protein